MNKKSEGMSDTAISLLVLVLVLIVLGSIFFGPRVLAFFKSVVGIITINSNKASKDNIQDQPWQKILEDYAKNKCQISRYSCKAENVPCQCFTLGARNVKEKPDTCSSQKPYCYDGQIGCSDRGPDVPLYFNYCQSTQNFKQEEISECIVDSECKPTNLPCRCTNAGKQSTVCLPDGNSYCDKNNFGCIPKPCSK